jgi:hypothetical protein
MIVDIDSLNLTARFTSFSSDILSKSDENSSPCIFGTGVSGFSVLYI